MERERGESNSVIQLLYKIPATISKFAVLEMLLIGTFPATPLSTTTTNSKEKPIGHQPGVLFFNPFPKLSVLSSTTLNSCSKISYSLSLNTTTHYQIIDYNVEILKSCKMGDLRNVMKLFSQSQKFGLESSTYCSVLQLCAEVKSLGDGKKVHDYISSIGGEIDTMVCAKLVFMYVNCGDLGEARRLFDTIENEKVFLWSLLISEYAKIGKWEESIDLYKRMRNLGVEANSYTLTCVLKCYAALTSVIGGARVHGYLIKIGFGSYNTVVNSLIAFYFRCRQTSSAYKLFDELTDRDVITWNSMITGYVSNSLADKALGIFIEMLSSSISVDLATMVNVLPAVGSLRSPVLARAIHACAVKARLDNQITFSNTLLDVYSKCGDLNGSVRVFENMVQRSVVTYTSLISGYAREGLFTEAIELFNEMKRDGVKPDVFTVTSILHACASNGSLEKGKEVHSYIKDTNMQLSLFLSNALIDMYGKCGSMEDALTVFSEMPRKDIVSWNTIIGCYSKNGLPNESIRFFVEMQNYLKPDNVTITCILPSCASLGALDRGRETHCFILRNGLSSDQFVMNSLVDMYVKCGALVLARSLFDIISAKNLVSWTVMIAGYGMHGFGKEAVSTFSEMRRAGVDPDDVSFTSILYACSHSGLLEEGWSFFDAMRNDFKIEPKVEHYACMVDLLSRAGKLSEAYRFIEDMPIKPDGVIWGALLCGCRIHHDVKLAEEVAEHVFELEPENTGYYVLLANIYAEAERWEEVKKLRKKTGLHGLKKEPGCSWIEMKGKVHIFVAGDDADPQAKNIELFINNLRRKIKEEGYSPVMRYALIDADEMRKEEALCGHSEKLAMAFGILNSPPGKIVRVTKNLRVCGDCHEMAKYISKVMGNDIILRDSNRFHHFKDGCCSCRGCW